MLGFIGIRSPSAPPGRRVYAVGNIHGRADLLETLLDQLDEDRKTGGFEGKPIIVFVGDYVDRGLMARAVVDRLLKLPEQGYEAVFLRGNHEAAMLDFMDRPETGPAWFALGGAETLYSYGVRVPALTGSLGELRFAAQALRAAMPAAHQDFFARLELFSRQGDYVFVHAGLRPGKPLERQLEADMLEIRDPFIKSRRRWPFVVVHGHTPVEQVVQDSRRIAIDTGAYATGRLSAVRLEGGSVTVLST